MKDLQEVVNEQIRVTFTFLEMMGAAASHAMCGDNAGHLIWPLIFAVLAVASWALRPQSRTLGVLFPAKTHALGPS